MWVGDKWSWYDDPAQAQLDVLARNADSDLDKKQRKSIKEQLDEERQRDAAAFLEEVRNRQPVDLPPEKKEMSEQEKRLDIMNHPERYEKGPTLFERIFRRDR